PPLPENGPYRDIPSPACSTRCPPGPRIGLDEVQRSPSENLSAGKTLCQAARAQSSDPASNAAFFPDRESPPTACVPRPGWYPILHWPRRDQDSSVIP